MRETLAAYVLIVALELLRFRKDQLGYPRYELRSWKICANCFTDCLEVPRARLSIKKMGKKMGKKMFFSYGNASLLMTPSKGPWLVGTPFRSYVVPAVSWGLNN